MMNLLANNIRWELAMEMELESHHDLELKLHAFWEVNMIKVGERALRKNPTDPLMESHTFYQANRIRVEEG